MSPTRELIAAVRYLRRNLAFTLIATAMMALGIGRSPSHPGAHACIAPEVSVLVMDCGARCRILKHCPTGQE